MANYEFLPGVDISVQDGGLILPEDTTTESMLIIAPSLASGAPTEPVLVRQSSDLTTNGFGDFYVNGLVNPIAAEWKAAQDAGNRRVYLCSLQGADDKARFVFLHNLLLNVLADFDVDHVVVKGVSADKEVSGLLATDLDVDFRDSFPAVPGVVVGGYAVTTDAITFPVTTVTGTKDTLVLTLQKEGVASKDLTVTLPAKTYDGVTNSITTLVADLNTELAKITPSDAKAKAVVDNGRIIIMLDAPFTFKSGTVATDLKLTAGTKATYTRNPAGPMVRGNFAQLVGDYAETQTLLYNSVIGYVGVAGPTQTTMTAIKTYVDSLVARNNDYSPYVQVVADEVGIVMPLTNQLYFMNGATHYAALVSQLSAESAPTNKVLKGARTVRYTFSRRQLNALTGKKYVTFHLKGGNLIVTDGVTTAPDLAYAGTVRSSDYARLSTLRITQTAVQVVRNAAERFIGQPNEMPQYNALNAAIKAELEAMRVAGALNDYRFSVIASSATLDAAKVSLVLIPMFELRRISVDVSLNPPAAYFA